MGAVDALAGVCGARGGGGAGARLALESAGVTGGLPIAPAIGAWLMHAIVGLMLVEQLYRGMPAVSRWGLKPLCLALAAGYIFELYLFADALLFSRIDADVWAAARGIATPCSSR